MQKVIRLGCFPMKIACLHDISRINQFFAYMLHAKWQFLDFRGRAHFLTSWWRHTLMGGTNICINGKRISISTGSNFRVKWPSLLIIRGEVARTSSPPENMFVKMLRRTRVKTGLYEYHKNISKMVPDL